jgi:hypothetical protein
MGSVVERWPRDRALEVRAVLDRIDVCGCGTDAHLECVLELLVEAETHSEKGFYRDRWFEWGAKVLDKWELLEHGSEIGFAWLTDDGRLVLEYLREFGTDDSGQPEWGSEFSWSEVEDGGDSYGEWVREAEAPAEVG